MPTAPAVPELRCFGIRHHGPGCARSLLSALQDWQPDCLLIEGPPEGQALIHLAGTRALQPPVALLVYRPDAPSEAVFYPFAVFSPEWQALQWAAQSQVCARFIDLPQTHRMALRQAAAQAPTPSTQAPESESAKSDQSPESAPSADPAEPPEPSPDPLDRLAHAAGEADGEAWWSRLIEERSSAAAADSADVFAAIAQAMQVLRDNDSESANASAATASNALREAWMRQSLRQARKDGFARIAVVCGAWHLPALQEGIHSARSDAALLKGLPKVKLETTWVPWNYRNLCMDSGYGAGIASPGWYEHLWETSAPHGTQNPAQNRPQSHVDTAQTATKTIAHNLDNPHARSVLWLSRVAQLLRSHDMDCSSAHLIDATRLAEGLAALRARNQPGLSELNEAVRATICMGESAPLRLIQETLIVGDRLGCVTADVPAVPLQRDIEQQQKTLRLKPEAIVKVLALDLRKEGDLARSHFLHRLRLLGIAWGEIARDAQRNRGTFRESWQLQWRPELAVSVIEASLYGPTASEAASARLRAALRPDTPLPAIAQAIDDALLADLPAATPALINALSQRAATTGDVTELLTALVPLAQVQRYGSVRQSDGGVLARLTQELALRAALGLPLACMGLNEDAARALHPRILAAHEVLQTISQPSGETQRAWYLALRSIAVGDAAAALLRGMASRLLLDAQQWDSAQAVAQFQRNLNLALPGADVAAWLDGFLNRQALVLLHDEALYGAVDGWLTALDEAQFRAIVPLVRRSFSDFSRSERHSLGQKALQRAAPTPSATACAPPTAHAPTPWDEDSAALALPLLAQWLGLALDTAKP